MKNSERDLEERQLPPLAVSLLTLLIVGVVFAGVSFINNAINYSYPAPQPLEVATPTKAEELYSPQRAQRRASYFLRRQGQEEERAAIKAEEEEGVKGEVKTSPGLASGLAESKISPPLSSGNAELAAPLDLGAWGGELQANSSLGGITLAGVMLGGETGVAIFHYQGATHTLGVGQSLGGYRVEEILSDRVILSKGGQRSTLSLYSGGSGATARDGHPILPNPETLPPPAWPGALARGSEPPVLAPQPQPVPLAPAPPLPNKVEMYRLNGEERETEGVEPPPLQAALAKESEPKESEPNKEGGEAGQPTREELERYLKRGAAIIAELKVQPQENALGVKVTFLRQDNILRCLGLEDGDIILQVNNKTILSREELFNALIALSEMPFVNIRYQRKGEEHSLVYDL